LDKTVPNQPTEEQLAANPLLHRYMIVFDREGYSVPFFIELKKNGIAFCTYRKNVKDKWDVNEFKEYTVKDLSGKTVIRPLSSPPTFRYPSQIQDYTCLQDGIRKIISNMRLKALV
jgi:hypothetical protein